MDEAKPNRRKRSPTDDKSLSLTRDCRNTYGETSKGSRKSIPRFKANSNRAGRHGVSQVLASAGASFSDGDERRLSNRAVKASRPNKTKAPDTPLREVIAEKKRKRAARVGGKALRAARREQ